MDNNCQSLYNSRTRWNRLINTVYANMMHGLMDDDQLMGACVSNAATIIDLIDTQIQIANDDAFYEFFNS